MIETFLVYASRSIEAYLESSLHLEEASGNPGMWYILFNIRNYFERKNHLIFMMQQPIVRILDKTMCFLLSFHICITIEKLHYIVRMCMCPPEHPMCNGSIVKQIALGSMVALFRPRSKCVRYHLGPFYTFYWSCPLVKRCWSRRFFSKCGPHSRFLVNHLYCGGTCSGFCPVDSSPSSGPEESYVWFRAPAL